MPDHNHPPIPAAGPSKRPWQPPVLRPVGKLADVLQGGSPKVTAVPSDPGEPVKVPGPDL